MKKTILGMQQNITYFLILTLLIFTNSIRADDFGSRLFLQLKQQIQQKIADAASTDYAALSAKNSNTSFLPIAPCSGGAGEIGGSVFGDYNKNGLDDQVGVIVGATVTYYECGTNGESTLAGTAVTDANGEFTLTGLTDGLQYRLEFTPPGGEGLTPGFVGDNGTEVQFITAPACNVKAAFSNPFDYCEDTGNPLMFATCFVNADPFAANSLVANEETIVYFEYQSTENSPSARTVSVASETGSVYGLAYAKSRELLFTSAFAKRHVALGSDNLGAIFTVDVTDPDNATVATLVNVNNIGINVGTLPDNATRGLGPDPASPSNDPDAYDAIGKRGIGAIVLSEDENTLWLTNLNDGLVYSIDLTDYYANGTTPTSSEVNSFTINAASACTNGTLRPFAINLYRGDIYVGAVCDAASGTAADLSAKVFRLTGTTFNEIADFNIGYTKGYAAFSGDCENNPGWYPWRSDLPDPCLGDINNSASVFMVNPTPILSGLEFDVNGDMVLGFTDRFGHQVGYQNYPPTGTTPLINTISGGDLLRASFDRNTGNYTLENNASAGGITTAGADNMQGPGGGEYYYFDVYEGGNNSQTGDNQPHRETSQGAIAFYPGSGDVATTALDPYSTSLNAGGINWFENTTGMVRNNSGYRLYVTVGSNSSSFQKANGLGEILIQCEDSAPVQVGTYVWDDANGNGVQDACEAGMDNINVALFDDAGTQMTTGTTADGGYIYFDSRTTTTLLPNATYYLVYGTGGQFDTDAMTINNDRSLTTADNGMGANADFNDSDATLAAANIAGGAITGLPYIEVVLGDAGSVSHNNGAGFKVLSGIGGEVWEDNNMDGILDATEFPIEGVTVTLHDANDDSVLGTMTTSTAGVYFFPDIIADDYYLVFDPSTNTANINNYQGTLQNQGDGTNDSDPDANTGRTADFSYNPNNGIDNEFDAGFFEPITDLTGFVFNDNNEDGIQAVSEFGIEGVTVTLFDTNDQQIGQVTTNAAGTYTFMNVLTGSYYLVFDPSTNNANIPNYQGTLQDQGNDDTIDSDPNPTNGRTDNFSFDATNPGATDVDAGYFIPGAAISGLAFEDLNNNGIQEFGEFGIAGVTATLFDNNDQQVTQTTTDFTGNYSFNNILLGTYYIIFDVSTNVFNVSNYQPTLQDQGGDDTVDSDINVNQRVNNFTFDPANGDLSNIDAGYFEPTFDISGFTWSDDDRDGIQDTGEAGIGGVVVTLFDSGDNQVDQATTNTNGTYTFLDVAMGDYYITFDAANNDNNIDYQGTLQNQGDGTNDSDPDPSTGRTATFTFTGDADNPNVDAGYIVPTADLTGFVWHDLNKDGIRTNNEPGIAGATAELFNTANVSQGTTTTDASGNYRFNDLSADDYYVQFDVSTNTANITDYMPSPQDQGSNDDVDSDANPATGRTANFTFSPTENTPLIGAGYFLEVTGFGNIGDYVFVDYNQDGIQDIGERGLGKVPVRLDGQDNANNPIQRATETDPNGFYMFTNVPAGTYTITFTLPTIYGDMIQFSNQNVGNNDDIDSDPNADGVTNSFTLSGGQNLINWDAGIEDRDPPVVVNPQGEVTLNCDDPDLFDPANIEFSDNIDLAEVIDIQLEEEIINPDGNACNGERVTRRTWTATDLSGNVGTFIQNIILLDNTPPTLMFTHPDLADVMNGDTIYTECTNDLPFGRDDVEAFDLCSDVTIDFYDFVENAGNCPTDGFIFEMVCTWTATDDCGNTTELTITVFFQDTEAPVIEGIPADMTVQCGTIPPPPASVTATDVCDNNVNITFMETRQPADTCSTYNLIRIWTATDDCGNTDSGQQVITVEVDDLAINGVPEDANVLCEEIPPVVMPTLSGDCYNPTLMFEETILGDTCMDHKIIRIWTATNDCGQTVQEIQSIFVTVPELEIENVPDNTTVDCDEIPEPVMPTLSHECYNGMIEFEETVLGDTCQEYKIIRTWRAENDCGQMATAVQTITVEIPPLEAEPKEDMMLSCDEEVPPATDPEVLESCFDYDITFSEETSQGLCPDDYTIEREWIITNTCGETETVEQIIEVRDTTKPEITLDHPFLNGLEESGATFMFDCGEEIPLILPENATASDNCDPNPDIEFYEEIENSANCARDGYVRRMRCGWIATDRCGNMCEVEFIILITDEEPPVIENCPDDIIVNLFSGETIPPIPSDVTATDNCGDVFVLFAESRIPNDDDCGFVLTRTWTAMDDCGNTTECVQDIKVNDACDCPNILVDEVRAVPTSCGEPNGAIFIETTELETSFTYEIVPDLGTSNLPGNERYNLPAGTYLVLIYREGADDCIEKTYVNIPETNCQDTINVTILNVPTEVCLNDEVFDFTGTITSTSICDAGNPNTVRLTNVNQECVTLTPSTGFVGTSPDLLCVVQCFNGDPNQCDTTYIRVTVDREDVTCNLQVTSNVTNIDCDNPTGNISLTVTGNVGQLTYQWTPNVSSSSQATDLTAGNYQVVISDSETGCSTTENYTISGSADGSITAADLIIMGIECPNGNTGDGGSISSASNRRFRVLGRNGVDFGLTPVSDLPGGKYEVFSEEGCEGSVIVDISTPDPWQFGLSTTPESCAGNDGIISLNIDGGIGNLTYVWTPNVSTNNQATGLDSNTDYSVQITDERGCVLTLTDLSITSNCVDGCTADAGLINTTDDRVICNQDDTSNEINLTAIGNSGEYRYVVTTTEGTILDITTQSSYDFSDADAGTYLIYGVAFNDNIPNLTNGTNINELTGCNDISNQIAITLLSADECSQSGCTVDGGTITTSGNLMPCTSDDSPDVITISATNTSGQYTYVLTDDNLIILEINDTPSFDIDGRPAGMYRLWGLAFDNTIIGATVGSSAGNLMGCFDLSNAVNVSVINDCGSNDGSSVDSSIGTYAGTLDDNICIPVRINGFTEISSFQFTFGYDGSIIDLVEIRNINPALTDYNSPDDFTANPMGISTSWETSAANGVTLADGATLFELCFDLVRVGTSDLTFIDTPTEINFTNADGETVALNGINGSITVSENTQSTDCEELFTAETLLFPVSECNEMAAVCLDIPLRELADYTIFLGGEEYTNGLLVNCDFDTTVSYNYAQLANANEFRVDSWVVDGTAYNGTFTSVENLVTAMNDWDSSSNDWTLAANQTITGGSSATSYGAIEITITSDNSQISLGLTTNFIPMGTELQLGVGTHQLSFNRDANCGDQLTIVVECRPNITKDTEEYTLNINETEQTCIDTTQLPGIVTSIQLTCISTSECEFVEFQEFDGCVEFTSVDVGTDTAEVIICDDLNFCDTTCIVVNSEFQQTIPLAVDDEVTTNQNISATIRVIENDQINGEVTTLKLMETPDFGAAEVMSDNTIIYTPQINYCGEDQMMYEVCNGAGCDDAMINITVDCGAVLIEPEPFTGFSPNGDGINDVFTINNIELLPDNQLTIYNREGVQVFKAAPYRNNWKGKWGTLDLPDGTYFYLLNYKGGKVMSGYIVIAR
ncbi:MAG: SdrD B-like domain-containing protein [Saprospiraceae bacterium]